MSINKTLSTSAAGHDGQLTHSVAERPTNCSACTLLDEADVDVATEGIHGTQRHQLTYSLMSVQHLSSGHE